MNVLFGLFVSSFPNVFKCLPGCPFVPVINFPLPPFLIRSPFYILLSRFGPKGDQFGRFPRVSYNNAAGDRQWNSPGQRQYTFLNTLIRLKESQIGKANIENASDLAESSRSFAEHETLMHKTICKSALLVYSNF